MISEQACTSLTRYRSQMEEQKLAILLFLTRSLLVDRSSRLLVLRSVPFDFDENGLLENGVVNPENRHFSPRKSETVRFFAGKRMKLVVPNGNVRPNASLAIVTSTGIQNDQVLQRSILNVFQSCRSAQR
mmetsp:Transcript_10241/g.24526  ORF Transcript_10241/g.24526 Transcript_10241/m.24526 type:complete len:130 (+) Transcript_10241:880-1269(+)